LTIRGQAKFRPLIASPTTAGTGSEVTPFTIVTDTRRNVKMLIGSPFLMPEIAVVDPSLTLSMPPNITAATGIDALTHAIEAYVSRKAQPLTDIFCLSAIRLISGNLRRAWAIGKDIEARESTMLGALQAGIAFANSSVALVHGMARPIGAYFHVAHGASNAALLSVVMDFSLSGNPSRYAQIAQAMGEDTTGLSELQAARKGVAAVKRLIKDIRVPSLRELGVDREAGAPDGRGCHRQRQSGQQPARGDEGRNRRAVQSRLRILDTSIGRLTGRDYGFYNSSKARRRAYAAS
jgi:alcohol dehydrogenase class IV